MRVPVRLQGRWQERWPGRWQGRWQGQWQGRQGRGHRIQGQPQAHDLGLRSAPPQGHTQPGGGPTARASRRTESTPEHSTGLCGGGGGAGGAEPEPEPEPEPEYRRVAVSARQTATSSGEWHYLYHLDGKVYVPLHVRPGIGHTVHHYDVARVERAGAMHAARRSPSSARASGGTAAPPPPPSAQ